MIYNVFKNDQANGKREGMRQYIAFITKIVRKFL